jgi:hypothetical protein
MKKIIAKLYKIIAYISLFAALPIICINILLILSEPVIGRTHYYLSYRHFIKSIGPAYMITVVILTIACLYFLNSWIEGSHIEKVNFLTKDGDHSSNSSTGQIPDKPNLPWKGLPSSNG